MNCTHGISERGSFLYADSNSGESNPMLARAGHFIQEDAGDEVAGHILTWMKR